MEKGKIIFVDVNLEDKISEFIKEQKEANNDKYIDFNNDILVNCDATITKTNKAIMLLGYAMTGMTVFVCNSKVMRIELRMIADKFGINDVNYEIVTDDSDEGITEEDIISNENKDIIHVIKHDEKITVETFEPKQLVIMYVLPTAYLKEIQSTITENTRMNIDIDKLKESIGETDIDENRPIGIIAPQLVCSSLTEFSDVINSVIFENIADIVYVANIGDDKPTQVDSMVKFIKTSAEENNITIISGENLLTLVEKESTTNQDDSDDVPSVDAEVVSE